MSTRESSPLRPDKIRADFVGEGQDSQKREFWQTLGQRRWRPGRPWLLVDGPGGVAVLRMDIDGSGQSVAGAMPMSSFEQLVSHGAAYLGWTITGTRHPLGRMESEDDSVAVIPNAEQQLCVRVMPGVPGDLRTAVADLILCARALATGPHSDTRTRKATRAISVAVEALRQITGEQLGTSETDPVWQALQEALRHEVAAGRMRKVRETVSVEIDSYEKVG